MALSDTGKTKGFLDSGTISGILAVSVLTFAGYALYAESYLHPTLRLLIGWSFIVLTIILYKIKLFTRVPFRLVFLLTASIVSYRYFIWRTTETLIYTGPFDLIGMTLLYLAEIYALIIHFLGIFVNIWPIQHESVSLLDYDDDQLPNVDVFVPTYNESEELVKITVTAATQMDYPKDKYKVYLLDDGSSLAKRNNPKTSAAAWKRHYELRRMAEEAGAQYITRERNVHAKAGNINHALKYTTSELVSILDCDHVPTRDFLKKTVGWFLKDPKLFLVQTPHFFINPTPVEKNLSEFSNLPAESDMFYKVIHLSLDFWNSSYFCGSAAVLRRSCLEEVGGICGETITEDAETSFVLHGKGYNSIYINIPMTCGLSPETFDEYILQRTRWAKGMTQLFVMANPLVARGLKLSQRLCYFNSCFFWLFGLSRMIFYLAPASFLLFGLKVYNASISQVIIYGIPHVICTFITMDYLYGKARQPFFSEIYESVQSVFLVPAIISVILNPRKPTFEITPKGTKLEAQYLNPLASTFFVLLLINVLAIPLAVMKWIHFPLFRDVIIITMAWTIFNIFISIISLGAFWEKRQVRNYHRARGDGPVRLFCQRLDAHVEGAIVDISLTGIGIDLDLSSPLKLGDDVMLEVFDSYGVQFNFNAKVQRHMKRGGKIFCGTEIELNKDSYARLVKYVYGDTKRWTTIWDAKSKPKGGGKELAIFFRMGLKASRDCLFILYNTVFSGIKKVITFAFDKAQTLYEKA